MRDLGNKVVTMDKCFDCITRVKEIRNELTVTGVMPLEKIGTSWIRDELTGNPVEPRLTATPEYRPLFEVPLIYIP